MCDCFFIYKFKTAFRSTSTPRPSLKPDIIDIGQSSLEDRLADRKPMFPIRHLLLSKHLYVLDYSTTPLMPSITILEIFLVLHLSDVINSIVEQYDSLDNKLCTRVSRKRQP